MENDRDQRKEDKRAADEYDQRLMGTFVSVILIGLFIFLTWLSIFYYYIKTI
ncbi:MAG TPA: cytochrome c oxidase subunit 2A [Bacillota bacterium]